MPSDRRRVDPTGGVECRDSQAPRAPRILLASLGRPSIPEVQTDVGSRDPLVD